MFLRPGTVLEAAWVGETLRFIEQADYGGGAAGRVLPPRGAARRRTAAALREVGRASCAVPSARRARNRD